MSSRDSRPRVPELVAFRARVTSYWKKHGRHTLPWRQTQNPYHVLVSEIMLQQTQVDRVIPYYERFVEKYPAVPALAEAPLSEVLRLWSGLGYNRRAKLLHDAAKMIVRTHGGIVPRERTALEALPGIGPYTAGAIRAFAFDERESFIETNIRTVFTHHFFPRAKRIDDAKLMPLIAMSVEQIRSPRIWYAALMDYGSNLKRSGVRINQKSTRYVPQKRFNGSLREVRGAIIRALVSNTSLAAVRRVFPERFDRARNGLAQDGLICRSGRGWRLAETEKRDTLE